MKRLAWGSVLSDSSLGTPPNFIRQLLADSNLPGFLSLGGGFPAERLFPKEQLKEILSSFIDKYGSSALQYCSTEGMPALLEEIVKIHAHEGVTLGPKNILPVAGSQMAISMCAGILLNRGNSIAVEHPSYVGALQAFHSRAARINGILMDNEGACADLLEKTARKLAPPFRHNNGLKFFYTVPNFQNPTGITMSERRRKDVVRLADEYRFAVLEDDPYGQIWFDNPCPPSLFAFAQKAQTNTVIYLRSFSKILVPGLRMGWVAADEELIKHLTLRLQHVGLCVSPFDQLLIAEFCNRGYLWPHIEKLRVEYKRMRDVMLGAMEKYMPKENGVRWYPSGGGLFICVTMPEWFNTDEMLNDAKRLKVVYVPGSHFFYDTGAHNIMRWNYSKCSEAEIEEAVKRMAEVIKTRLFKGKKR